MTIDWTVLVAGIMGLGLVFSAEVVRGLENVTDEYDGINTGQGMMTMFVNNPAPQSSIPATTPDDTTSDETTPDETASDDTEECNAANPGNDKCVGNAGEAPNGDESDWGDGSTGQSDVRNKGRGHH